MVLIHKKGVFSGFGSLGMVLIHKKGRFSGYCSLRKGHIHKKGRFSGYGLLEMGVWVEDGMRFVEVVCSGEMLVVFFNCS